MDEFGDIFANIEEDEDQEFQSLSLLNDWSFLFDGDDTNIWYALETAAQDLENYSHEQEESVELSLDFDILTEQPKVYDKVPEYCQSLKNDEKTECYQTTEVPKQTIGNDDSVGNCETVCSSSGVDVSPDNKLYTKIPSYLTGIIGHQKPSAATKLFSHKDGVTQHSDDKPQMKPSASDDKESRILSSGKRGRQSGSFPQRKYPRSGFQTFNFQSAKCFPSSRNLQRTNSSIYEKLNSIEDRKIVYVGNVSENTTTTAIRQRFAQFGKIADVSLHFREHGDNYGFVTFSNTSDAIRAIDHGNDDPQLPKYELCFGGRRHFCRSQYSDLDSFESSASQRTRNEADFDTLLKNAKTTIER